MTPAFIGSGEEARAEWNGKAVRGELRWWFRALAGGELQGNAARVRALELEVFGGAADTQDNREGDHCSALRVMVNEVRADLGEIKAKPPPAALNESDLAELWNAPSEQVKKRLRLTAGATNPIGYLGYGPIVHKPGGLVYQRGWIPPESDLAILLQWSSQVQAPAKDLFDRALWCWINLGGVGARSRRGFGSLVRMEANEAPADLPSLKKRVNDVLGSARKPLPAGQRAAWSHFTSDAHVYGSPDPYKTWTEAMKVAGAWMISFRRRYGISTDERGPKVQNRDYEWFKAPKANGVPDRAGFGLPLPFSKKDVAAWGENHEGRRASPLLIHIAKFSGNDHRIVLTHIPARLVPDGEKISFKGARSAPTTEQEQIVHEFLGDLAGKKLIEVLL